MKKAILTATLVLIATSQMSLAAETGWGWKVDHIKVPSASASTGISGDAIETDGWRYELAAFNNGTGLNTHTDNLTSESHYDLKDPDYAFSGTELYKNAQVNVFLNHDFTRVNLGANYDGYDATGYWPTGQSSSFDKIMVLADILNGTLDLSTGHFQPYGSYKDHGFPNGDMFGGGDPNALNEAGLPTSVNWYDSEQPDGSTAQLSMELGSYSGDLRMAWFAVVSVEVWVDEDGGRWDMYYMIVSGFATNPYPNLGNNIINASNAVWYTVTSKTAVPEPATAAMGLFGIALLFRRKRK